MKKFFGFLILVLFASLMLMLAGCGEKVNYETVEHPVKPGEKFNFDTYTVKFVGTEQWEGAAGYTCYAAKLEVTPTTHHVFPGAGDTIYINGEPHYSDPPGCTTAKDAPKFFEEYKAKEHEPYRSTMVNLHHGKTTTVYIISDAPISTVWLEHKEKVNSTSGVAHRYIINVD